MIVARDISPGASFTNGVWTATLVVLRAQLGLSETRDRWFLLSADHSLTSILSTGLDQVASWLNQRGWEKRQ